MTDIPASPVRVTIGIPLYAAHPWFDHIAANIERLAAPDVEFLLADQHGLDDTLERLQQQFEGRARLRCHQSRAALDWIGNYNFLLQHAQGDYVRILTQDDTLEPASLRAAVAALDADGDCVLVVGPGDQVDPSGRVLQIDARGPGSPMHRSAGERRRDALAMFGGWIAENANLGLVRRAVAMREGLLIPHTAGLSGLSVRAWLFALALRGGIRYLPDYVSQRCVHPASYTSTHWKRSPLAQLQRAMSYLRAGAAAWGAAPMPVLVRLGGWPLLVVCVLWLTTNRLLRRTAARCGLPALARSR